MDEAEEAAGERIGGPTAADTATIRLLEARLGVTAPETTHDWRWAAQRLARALVNGWCADAAATLAGLAGDPLTAGSG